VTRLLDMGIEPYLVASSLVGVVAQRLVRCLCPRCKRPFAPTEEYLQTVGLVSGAPDALYEPGECEVCRKGYLGRTGIFEMLPVDDEVRRQVVDKVSSNEVKQRAVEKGMRTLLYDGREKVLNGLTTIEEVMRVCQRDEL